MSDQSDGQVLHVATYNDLPARGSAGVSYFIADEDAFYLWTDMHDGSGGYFEPAG